MTLLADLLSTVFERRYRPFALRRRGTRPPAVRLAAGAGQTLVGTGK